MISLVAKSKPNLPATLASEKAFSPISKGFVFVYLKGRVSKKEREMFHLLVLYGLPALTPQVNAAAEAVPS